LSLSHPVRGLAVLAVAAVGSLALGTGVASAHVTVGSSDAAPGGYGKITFRVPNESDASSTVALRVQLPTATPLTSLRAQPVPGWTVTLTPTTIDPPVQVDGDTVDTAVSVVEFRAVPGGGIAPGEFQEFALSGGPFPDTDSLTFNAVQTYSDGSEAAWIEPTVAGQAEPEHPAPVLALTSAGAAPVAAAAGASPAEDGDGTAVTALVLAVLGLLAGLGGLFLGFSARRRTVAA
jgi:uncharacterized protein YcnI